MGGDGIAQSAEMTASCPAAFPSGAGFLPGRPVWAGFTARRRTDERPKDLWAFGCAAIPPRRDPVPAKPAALEQPRGRNNLSRFQNPNAPQSAPRTQQPQRPECLRGMRPVSDRARHSSGGSRRRTQPGFQSSGRSKWLLRRQQGDGRNSKAGGRAVRPQVSETRKLNDQSNPPAVPHPTHSKAHPKLALGTRHLIGIGVKQSIEVALTCFREAALEGDAGGQFALGLMYKVGRGVPKDESEAMAWFRRAAEQGDARSQNELGAHFAENQDVPGNAKEGCALVSSFSGSGFCQSPVQSGEHVLFGYRRAAGPKSGGRLVSPGS